MNFEMLLPLIGVAVGWFLNEIGSSIRGRAAKKRAIGKTISQLLYLRNEKVRLAPTLDILKDHCSSWEEFEKIRQVVTERHISNGKNFEESLDEAVNTISEFDPLTAVNIRRIKEAHLFNKKYKFSDSSVRNPDLYIQFLSTIEAAELIDIDYLEELLLKISFSHGMITWFKLKRTFSKTEANIKQVKEYAENIHKLMSKDKHQFPNEPNN